MRNRYIINDLKKRSQSRFGRILVITGARQTGKTTLVGHVFNTYPYLSIEDPVTAESYKKLTAKQWSTHYPNAVLDEIQKVPQLIESIKSVYDQYEAPRYVILGSSQIMLLKQIRESLAGRCQIIELYPLTLPEMLTNSWNHTITLSGFQQILQGSPFTAIPFALDSQHPQKKEVFNQYLKFGAYPAISDPTLTDQEKYDWLRNYVRTYLERDIRDLAELRQLDPFTRVQKLLAINTAQLTNFSQIASAAGVSSKTAQRFLEYMGISYQTLALQAWSRNKSKRLVKSPKIHYLDIGVARSILQKKEELTGHEFESAIVAEIYKQAKAINPGIAFYHLRTSDGREIDLLLELEQGYIAIEIKKTEHIRAVDARHFKDLENILDKPVLHGYILSNDMEIKDFEPNVKAIPAVQFLT
jgi:predicted AAA+ superfamily ATPase